MTDNIYLLSVNNEEEITQRFRVHYALLRRATSQRSQAVISAHFAAVYAVELRTAYTVQLWLVAYFSGHSHCTSYRGHISAIENITASIVQGSAIGPVSYTLSMPLTFYPSHLVTSFASTLTTRVSLYRRTMSTPEWLK